MKTNEREKLMATLARISGEMQRLESQLPTTREIELRDQYPRMPRQRLLRLVAEEIVNAR